MLEPDNLEGERAMRRSRRELGIEKSKNESMKMPMVGPNIRARVQETIMRRGES